MSSPLETDFDRYFAALYGDRWPVLRASLSSEPDRVAHECFSGFSRYTLDAASIRAARALRPEAGERVLDLCAAPGGKSLVLLDGAPTVQLIANEFSSARRRRLQEVIRTHVPPAEQERVRITGYDGNRFGLKTPGEFDRVLLDAPCSSERHLIEQGKVGEWTESRTKQLSKRQYSLLCAAILAARPGGTIVYSTCSISPLENDGVVGRALERKSDQVEVDPDLADLTDLERTKFGFQIFPDRAGNQGPMYIARLRRR